MKKKKDEKTADLCNGIKRKNKTKQNIRVCC